MFFWYSDCSFREKRFPDPNLPTVMWPLKCASRCTLINIQALTWPLSPILRPFLSISLYLGQSSFCPLLPSLTDLLRIPQTEPAGVPHIRVLTQDIFLSLLSSRYLSISLLFDITLNIRESISFTSSLILTLNCIPLIYASHIFIFC